MFFARKSHICREIVQEEIRLPMHTGDHSVHDKQVPPRPPPAFLESRVSAPVRRGIRSGIQPEFDSYPFCIREDVSRLVVLATTVEADDGDDHGLHKEAIFRGFWGVQEPHGFLEEGRTSRAHGKIQRTNPSHRRKEMFDVPFLGHAHNVRLGQHSRVSGVKVKVKGVDTLLWDGSLRHLPIEIDHGAIGILEIRGPKDLKTIVHGCSYEGRYRDVRHAHRPVKGRQSRWYCRANLGPQQHRAAVRAGRGR